MIVRGQLRSRHGQLPQAQAAVSWRNLLMPINAKAGGAQPGRHLTCEQGVQEDTSAEHHCVQLRLGPNTSARGSYDFHQRGVEAAGDDGW